MTLPNPIPGSLCRRCIECVGEEHHWLTSMPECPDEGEPFIPCKHCDARAAICEVCCEAAVWPIMSDQPICAECRKADDPDDLACCPGCNDPVRQVDLVSLTGHPDLCPVCADEACKRAPVWDHYGAPRLPHVPCPRCGEVDQIASLFDAAWCGMPGCGWRGSLLEMRGIGKATLADTAERPLPLQTRPGWGDEERREASYTFWDRVAVVGVTALCAAAAGAVILSWWWSR